MVFVMDTGSCFISVLLTFEEYAHINNYHVNSEVFSFRKV